MCALAPLPVAQALGFSLVFRFSNSCKFALPLPVAQVTDSYDIGVLISGDKDFMPAMSRVKQKGKRMVP